ncbi:hypothetical protein CGCF415_v007485 [Colletotrichum fructicola]|nr:uncharacterized protein CGMCC3_g8238 [Colletotrichum fructicola]KAF4484155.1 hypothetical protein CGGC5_v007200 [Colletotrichum fructicola Nara gc5]KAE9575745.1 hypothetical protein CGMCC3_g8238 [Colletotrichum fructicola]KAF4411487.1 hypothetical protein CFRS1_v006483 [Colletotrichum fructicola]KAF4883795.1 hypothetical protein CGCFRS4_v013244 [Colletotrichum fructicola]KAF4907049.1 hypothetical protein CGCF415_v007485 [Colletotrichum fructicola]
MLSRLKANSYGLNIEWLKVKNKETLHKIRRIAVPWSAFHAGQQRFLTQIERDARWRLLLGNLRGLFPNLTDIYLFIPVVRQLPSYDSSSDRHSQEPAKCKSLRPRLEHILENYDVVKLPACDCLEKPSTLGEAICEIRSVLEPEDGNELDWVYRDWRQSLKVHGRWLAREGLDMDSLRGVPGIEVEKAFCKEARRETEDCNI